MKESANTGSMPEEQPARMERVPVGAMVVTVALRSGSPWPYIELAQLGKAPRCAAMRCDSW